MSFISNFLYLALAFAGEGPGHTHNMTDELWPILGILLVVGVIGAIFHFKPKKK